MQKVELVSPAGNPEKLKMAVLYGADAVYLGGAAYNLRAFAGNFSDGEMLEGIRFAHSNNCKVYLALNIFAHNSDIEGLRGILKQALANGVDAVIVSDPGVMAAAKDMAPDIPIHLSTQANTMNWASAAFWYKSGTKRVILARELSLLEIAEIRRMAPSELELEVFVHGAMCISYSGRCFLSNYLASRSSNAGACAQPCRWKYSLVEEKRPGQYLQVYEDPDGTFIMNSKDLCMIAHIPELIETGVSSFKIEGRMKSPYYTAIVTKMYREAIDSYYSDAEHWSVKKGWLDEIAKASRRECDTGFYFGSPGPASCVYTSDISEKDYDFIGIITGHSAEEELILVEQRNRFFKGDIVEIIPPVGPTTILSIEHLYNEDGMEIESAPHPQMKVKIPFVKEFPKYSILRRRSTGQKSV